MIDVLKAILFWTVLMFPTAVTLVAFLDVARRPSWVWALAGRSQILWLWLLGMALLTFWLGILAAIVYAVTVRGSLIRAERGEIA